LCRVSGRSTRVNPSDDGAYPFPPFTLRAWGVAIEMVVLLDMCGIVEEGES
jgi:hypothetical protein